MDQRQPALAIVIPVHNRREITRTCLLALRRQTYTHFTTVVVDDGSSDGTWEMLAAEFPEVIALRGDGSLWWTGATNRGCAWALGRGERFDAVVVLNDDTEPAPAWLAALVLLWRGNPTALVGSLVVEAQSGRTLHAEERLDWWTAKYRRPWRGVPATEVRRRAGPLLTTDLLCGTGTLIPVRALRELGPFDSALPQYAADYEFSRRAADAGWTLVVSTDGSLQLNQATTGLRPRRGDSLGDLFLSLWSRRSSTGWPYRVRFALRACPRAALPSYLAFDAVRIVVGGLRDYVLRRLGLPPRPSELRTH